MAKESAVLNYQARVELVRRNLGVRLATALKTIKTCKTDLLALAWRGIPANKNRTIRFRCPRQFLDLGSRVSDAAVLEGDESRMTCHFAVDRSRRSKETREVVRWVELEAG
jgi:hypothetical protein